MTEHYVTLFDKTFLPQGLALHQSLIRHAGDHELWIVAMDEVVETFLTNQRFPHVNVLPLSEVESHAILDVRASRSTAEYCWTLTPFTYDAVLERSDATRVTYIDADMWFASSPQAVFSELESSRAASLITEHAYAPEYEQSDIYGRFCVQFMPFVRGSSDRIRATWQRQCLEWCFATPEPGRFGDQKYLDSWPTDFPADVHVLEKKSLMQAPWNAIMFAPGDAVAYHFHRLRIVDDHRVYPGLYRLPAGHISSIYRPYLRDLRNSCNAMVSAGLTIPIQMELPTGIRGIKEWLAFRQHNWRSPFTPYTLRF